MTIEQERICAVEALARASDTQQRLMFREGAKWMDAEHAALLAASGGRGAKLRGALVDIVDAASQMDLQIHGEWGTSPYVEDQSVVDARKALEETQ